MPTAEAALAGLGWVASPVVEDLVNKSISYLGSDIAKGLEDLETTLLPQFQLTIQAAQHRSHDVIAPLAKWLARLKIAYYDAEGILHELEYERLKRKAEGQDKKLLVRLSSKPIIKPFVKFMGQVRLSSKPIIKPFVKFLGQVCLSSKRIIKPLAKFGNRAVKKAYLMSPQKRELLKRLNKLKEVAAEAETFRDLLSIQNTESTQNVGNNPFVTSSLLGNADKVFGRDRDREEIINFLLNEQEGSSSAKRYSVVAVTGMGGAGKTTLAQYVYNDPRVQNYFDVRMWLCLSQKFDIIEVTKEMIECASKKQPDLCNLNNLQEELVKTLPDSKKVVVVLDDIWYDNNDGAAEKKQWENLLKPFDFRGGICKIVVTSRSSWSFPIELQPGKLIQLGDLATDDFKLLLRYHAIDGLQISNPQMKNYLSDIVDQIGKKMSKLPLAAKVVGNQLRERPEISFWRDTLEKVNLSDIMDILLWSFHRFDVQLQRCFLFCSIFPKGQRHHDDLITFWVALDFIQSSDDKINAEKIGLGYIEIMVANSIFRVVIETRKVYIMHDLFHDLAEKLSAEDCFRVTNADIEIPSTVQHVYLQVNNENLSSICNLSNLRTLILGNSFIDDISEIITKISTNFRNLRVLFVMSKGYKILPEVVGDLKNLRFLCFWRSSIKELPDSVLQLYHLQFLILPSSVKTLPNKLSNLIKLRRIEMYGSDAKLVNTLPPVPYLSKLTSLQRLDEFHVRKEEGYELQQLGRLKEIGGFLRIVNLENVRDKEEAVQARLIDKPELKKLELVWDESAEINGLEIEVIEALRPPTNMEYLIIDGYRGSTYPSWLQEGSFRENIKDVRFYNCNALTSLSPDFHQFRHCSELYLRNLGALTELSTFPENLARLSIIKCPCFISICENEVQVNENQSIDFPEKQIFCCVSCCKDILDDECKSFKQTVSLEKCARQLQIIESAAQGNASESSVHLSIDRAWWSCHQQRMNFIFRCNTRANKLKLPSMLRILELGYCCVSDGALSDCLRELVTLEELYLSSMMTITTLPPAQVLESLQRLQVLVIRNCWYLRSLGGLRTLPQLQRFLVLGCFCLGMGSGHTPLPPTLQSFIIIKCHVSQAILNGNLSCLQEVVIQNCPVPRSLSFRQLTELKSLVLFKCSNLFSIQGLESRPFISTLHLVLLPNLAVESVMESWKGCRQALFISSTVMLNKLLSSQDFVLPQQLVIEYCEEEAISFEKSDHLQSIKMLEFSKCKTEYLPITLSDFSTLKCIHFIDCPKISGLSELPDSIQHIRISGCPVLRERCQPNGLDRHKIRCIPYVEIE